MMAILRRVVAVNGIVTVNKLLFAHAQVTV